jgi:hypothetical protein
MASPLAYFQVDRMPAQHELCNPQCHMPLSMQNATLFVQRDKFSRGCLAALGPMAKFAKFGHAKMS